ncbi:MAG TPA: hypothetical protein VN776_10935 [Terracidiphilus sp.]|nr:hypothetical protein [Terracidiphilus sp.]
MTEDLQPDPLACTPADNPAIARCLKAYDLAHRTTLGRTNSRACARLDGKGAYRKAMPPLAGPDNIRDFIACTAHGMLIEAIDETKGARLLYAAHIAHSTAPKPPAFKKNPA